MQSPTILAAALQQVLDDERAAHGFPGATAAVVTAAGTIAAAATGHADIEAAAPMATDTLLLQASIGKTYVGALAVRLAGRNELDLDQPLARWFSRQPWLRRVPNASGITLRMLLNHTAGIPEHLSQPAFRAAITRLLADPDFVFKPDELVGFVLDQAPLFPPGTGFAYTDTAYVLAGLMIEWATATDPFALLSRELLVPLGLENTVAALSRSMPRLAQGYRAPDNPAGLPARALSAGQLTHHPANEWTGGGLASTATDLALFGDALLRRDAIVEDYGNRVLAQGAQITGIRTGRYGLGLFGCETPLGPRWGHGGWTPGYRSDLGYYVHHKLTTAVLVNTDIETQMSGAAIVTLGERLAAAALDCLDREIQPS
jgi:D-alanyl-D-alanine carboxypeptidase